MSDIETIRYDLNMWQGATFALTVAVKSAANGLSNVNLTGCSARMQIREQYDSNTAAETLSSSNGEIIFDTANGVMSIELDAENYDDAHSIVYGELTDRLLDVAGRDAIFKLWMDVIDLLEIEQ